MQKGEVEAFAGRNLPFYELHARLYLLIALLRASIDDTTFLKPHAEIFKKIALQDMPHVLIQRYAADIALNIEKKYPRTYTTKIIERLQHVGQSPFRVKIEKYSTKLKHKNASWNTKNIKVNKNPALYFGIDFEPYWVAPLANIFNAPLVQTSELISKIVTNEFKINESLNYRDPRYNQYTYKDVQHSHGRYPYVDDYKFYYSYHGLLSGAARLIGKMPIVCSSNDAYERSKWNRWLKLHSLTHCNGKWLADRRDPSPIQRRQWINESLNDNWSCSINREDFLDCLTRHDSFPKSLCVFGYWKDHHGYFEETIRISSALVSPLTSQALANALRSCKDPLRYRLPYYLDHEHEYNKPPFELQGWIAHEEDCDSGLDNFDPYAKEIPYPPFTVGKSIETLFKLKSHNDCRTWYLPNSQKPSLRSELWSDKDIDERRDEGPYRFGNRMNASILFLKELCRQLDKELIIEVQIERQHYDFGRKNYEFGYVPPSHKIFIFSSKGVLKDAERSHTIG
jgi:hypothetical protein